MSAENEEKTDATSGRPPDDSLEVNATETARHTCKRAAESDVVEASIDGSARRAGTPATQGGAESLTPLRTFDRVLAAQCSLTISAGINGPPNVAFLDNMLRHARALDRSANSQSLPLRFIPPPGVADALWRQENAFAMTTRFPTLSTGAAVSGALAGLEKSSLAGTIRLPDLWVRGPRPFSQSAVIEAAARDLGRMRLDEESVLASVWVADLARHLAGSMVGTTRLFSDIESALEAQLAATRGTRRLWEDVRSIGLATDRLWRGLAADAERFARLGPALAEIPTIELYTASRAAAAVVAAGDVEDSEIATVQEVESALADIAESFEARLGMVDSMFVAMWRGAHDRIEHGGYDATRQALISLRELSMHVLHRLTPDDAVVEWARADQIDDKGRPTRKARLEYLARAVNDGDLVEVLKADFKSTLTLFDLLNKVHKADITMTRQQLRVIAERVQSQLSWLLTMAEL